MVLAKDLQYLLSDEAKSRQDSPLKAAFKYRMMPGMRSLGGGLPIAELFPFDNVHMESPAVPFDKGIELKTYDDAKTLDVHITRAIDQPAQDDVELRTSLQYGVSSGEPRLRDFIKEHTKKVHKIGYEDWDVLISIGNTFTWDATLRTFTNRGDPILVEEFAFSSALETASANGCKAVGVRMDLEGIVPEALETQMANWVGPRPKLLYTVPTGQNPTGSSLSAERRQRIYEIAKKYDFLIIEDEPYYYLQFPKYSHPAPGGQHAPCESASSEEMIKSFVPSFLDFDTEGRVIRLDSFSKVIAPGTRLSWIVAQERFIERYLRLEESSAQTPSGFSTSAVYGLLRRWGQDGYLLWLNKLKSNYAHSRDIACDTIYENFPKGLYEFEPPIAGMFYWIKIDSRRFKGFKDAGGDPVECEKRLFQKLIEKNVLVAPGHWFVSTAQTTPPQPEVPKTENEKYALYFRGTFAGVSHEVLKSALADVGQVLHEELTEELAQ